MQAVQKIQHEEATVARELATSPIKSISSAAGLGWNSAASDYHVINEEHPDEALHAVDSSHPCKSQNATNPYPHLRKAD